MTHATSKHIPDPDATSKEADLQKPAGKQQPPKKTVAERTDWLLAELHTVSTATEEWSSSCIAKERDESIHRKVRRYVPHLEANPFSPYKRNHTARRPQHDNPHSDTLLVSWSKNGELDKQAVYQCWYSQTLC
eukprot:gene6734-8057_t